MRIYNSDGSEPQMCGNGIRCMAKYLLSEIEKKSDANNEVSYNIWTNAGKIVPKLKNGEITVDMGEPILVPEKIPTLIKANKDGKVIDADFNVADHNYKVTTVSMVSVITNYLIYWILFNCFLYYLGKSSRHNLFR